MRMFARGAKAERDFSFIGPEVTITGNIATTGRLHVDGTVNGDIRCGTLTQGAKGAVHGNIIVESATLAGLVDGAVEAGLLTLEASARITGDVLYESLGVAAGAQVEGRFRRRKGTDDHGASVAREEAGRQGNGAADLAAAREAADLAARERASARGGPQELFGSPDAPTVEAAE